MFFPMNLFYPNFVNANSCFIIRRYTMVLADNVDGGDDLDLIVTTMNGNVFCFSTPSPHHSLKVRWSEFSFSYVQLMFQKELLS